MKEANRLDCDQHKPTQSVLGTSNGPREAVWRPGIPEPGTKIAQSEVRLSVAILVGDHMSDSRNNALANDGKQFCFFGWATWGAADANQAAGYATLSPTFRTKEELRAWCREVRLKHHAEPDFILRCFSTRREGGRWYDELMTTEKDATPAKKDYRDVWHAQTVRTLRHENEGTT